MRSTLFSFFLATSLASPFIQADLSTIQVTYGKPQNKTEAANLELLQQSDVVKIFSDLVDSEFKLKYPIKLKFGAEDGPLYDPANHELMMPYSFLEESQQRFAKAKYEKTGVSVNEATLDAVQHTLFHELAHALIAMYDLPIVGKEEDAADNLATVLLIEYLDDGAEVAISAADLFDLEGEEVQELGEADFWDEHSLDAQRYYTTMCHVYGSDPQKYKEVKTEAGFDKERAETCSDDYTLVRENWFKLLKPIMKNPT